MGTIEEMTVIEIDIEAVATLVSQSIGIGVVIAFSMALLGFVINKIIKLGMGNL